MKGEEKGTLERIIEKGRGQQVKINIKLKIGILNIKIWNIRD